jgi:dihydrofolate reductase
MISIICSVGKNLELGKNNDLIWHFSKDLKYFKNVTMGHTVVMGLNTYYSLPGNLPGRKMIVLSPDANIEGVENLRSIEEVVDRYKGTEEEVFVMGGASIYRQFLPYADKLYLTEIDDECTDADVYFPEFNRRKWKKKTLKKDMENDIQFKMCLYEKREKDS